MKIHDEVIELTTKEEREFVNVTSRVKAAIEKSGLQNGIVLVSSLHVNAGVFMNDEEPGLQQDIADWAAALAPARNDYKHAGRFESNASAHLQALLLNHQVVIGFAAGRLELGPWQQVFFADLDGQRPRRIQVKVMGE